ncbi:hypothetical protein FB451DRAFT_1416491 [Mycena latifolia]|nr:hypothetical protein FB451DRAFT_1416491 [Mycena latifolia]
MVDKEKGPVPSMNTDDPSEEAAAAKLWAVYISEAEKYDKALVESWKSDMEGMLIFAKAGLFSASLTAFLIESYKTLNPDSGDTTVKLLTQISLQLAASANGSTLQLPESTPFTPPAALLVCNGLWFISLGFSLTCALIATLLEQWARDFLHKADMRSAPVIRARVYSYLYYGLKRFNMHTVVEIIPLLLHASLLFFFAGLVAFLIPVNAIMTAITGVLLFIVASVYAVLTLLPLRYLDSPYRTPLSGAFWWLFHTLKRLWKHRHAPGAGIIIESQLSQRQSMVKAMFNAATQPSDDRWARDNRALVWTMKSLADDNELEPFVNAIPDVLWDPRDRLHAYEEHIQHLTDNPELEVLPRIHGLFKSCDTGLLSPEVIKHRRIACYKALWAVASLCIPAQSSGNVTYAVEFLDASWAPIYYGPTLPDPGSDRDIFAYRISAKAMMEWSNFCSLLGAIHEHQEYLMTCTEGLTKGQIPDLTSVTSFVQKYKHFHYYAGELSGSPESLIPQLKEYFDTALSATPHIILWNYLEGAASLTSAPHRWHATQENIILPHVKSYPLLEMVESYLDRIIHSHLQTLNAASDRQMLHWVDSTLSRLLASWQPQDSSNNTIPRAIIRLLNERNSNSWFDEVLWSGEEIQQCLWSAFPHTLSQGPSKPRFSNDETPPRESLFTALWHLAFLPSGPIQARVKDIESVLEILVNIDPSFPPISQSIIALIKNRLVTMSMNPYVPIEERQSSFITCIFPEHTAIPVPDKLPSENGDSSFTDPQAHAWELYQQQKVLEAKIYLLAEFLEHCSADPLPYKVVETLRRITDNLQPVRHVHAIHQNRFANSMHNVFAARPSPKLLSVIVDCHCWDLYADGPPIESNWWDYAAENLVPWLNDPDARHNIQAVFMEYEHMLSLSNDFPDTLTRLRTILGRLDSLHSENMVRPTATSSTGHAENEIEGGGGDQAVDKPSPAPNMKNSASEMGGKGVRVEGEPESTE